MTLDLNELERVGNSATAGPWSSLPSYGECVGSNELWCDSQYLGVFNTPWHSKAQQEADRDFCVAARNKWQAMIDEIRHCQEAHSHVDALNAKRLVGEHWLSVVIERIAAGEDEVAVLNDYGWKREDSSQ